MALGFQIAGIFNEGISAFKAIYMYPTIPFGGAILAVLFYELVYKKTQNILSRGAVDDASSNDSMGEHD